MESLSGAAFAPDMGIIGIRLPTARIVLLSWIVSEYDGLGFVRTENHAPEWPLDVSVEKPPTERIGCVSLFYPEKKRNDVLELLRSLRNEGMELEILFEGQPSYNVEAPTKVWTLEDFDT